MMGKVVTLEELVKLGGRWVEAQLDCGVTIEQIAINLRYLLSGSAA